jgi:pimeloyl-ACP methyl ester carboxylesterase|tara:strand:- start:92 stop:892 length:801 start_codon:yes stop_codon:yes gene_type:complete
VISKISFEQTQITYEVYGDSERALVFVHGWLCNRSFWKDQIKHFKNDYTVVAIDLRGHGQSSSETEKLSINAFAQDVTAVISSLGLSNVTIIGHSLGGLVVLETARLNIIDLQGVVVVDELGGEDLFYSYFHKIGAWLMLKFGYDRVIDSMVKKLYRSPATNYLAEEISGAMKEVPTLTGINSLFGEGHYFDYINHISEALREVSAPIAIFNAGEAPPKHKFETLNQELLVTKGMLNVSHFLMMEQSTEFNELLESIFSEFKLILR